VDSSAHISLKCFQVPFNHVTSNQRFQWFWKATLLELKCTNQCT